jgi:hypothetical protein
MTSQGITRATYPVRGVEDIVDFHQRENHEYGNPTIISTVKFKKSKAYIKCCQQGHTDNDENAAAPAAAAAAATGCFC